MLKKNILNDRKDSKNYSFVHLKKFFVNYISLNKHVFLTSILILNVLIQKMIYEIIRKQNNYSVGKQYIDKCLNYTHICKNALLNETPIISVIIPAYNCEKTIFFPIISIQNQNISNFEIILINDFSRDNTSKILQEFKEQDKRLKIINNKKNMGTLYSRCIATLISKGEYIFPLDNDDMIFGEDILYCLNKKAKEGNYDIIGFKAVYGKAYNENIRKMKDIEKYPNQNIFIHKYGIFHLIRPLAASSLQPINNKFFGLLFLVDIIFNYSRNNEDKIYSVFAALYIMNYYYKDKSIININNLSYLEKIISKINKSKYINDNYKNILLKKLKTFLL